MMQCGLHALRQPHYCREALLWYRASAAAGDGGEGHWVVVVHWRGGHWVVVVHWRGGRLPHCVLFDDVSQLEEHYRVG